MEKNFEFIKTGVKSINAYFDPDDPDFCVSCELDSLYVKCAKEGRLEKEWVSESRI